MPRDDERTHNASQLGAGAGTPYTRCQRPPSIGDAMSGFPGASEACKAKACATVMTGTAGAGTCPAPGGAGGATGAGGSDTTASDDDEPEI